MNADNHYDILVVGGGAVGLSFLQGIKSVSNLKVLLLEVRHTIHLIHDRYIVLSESSRFFYQSLKLWDEMLPYCTKIDNIKINVQGQYGSSVLKASDISAPALGYVIALSQLEKILAQNLNNDVISMGSQLIECNFINNIWHISYQQNGLLKKITACSLIGADGQDSLVRIENNIELKMKEYGHQAIIGTVDTTEHHNQAFERLLKNGAIAFLPLAQKKSVFIWTLAHHQAVEYMNKSNSDFLKSLQNIFGYRLGIFSNLYSRNTFSLNMTQAKVQAIIQKKLLLMGTAALNVHPIGAQGLNLSLRTVNILSRLIKKQMDTQSFNMQWIIPQYLEKTRVDQGYTQWMTDSLASNASGGPFPLLCRAIGLLAFDSISPIKKMFTKIQTGLI